MPRPAQTKPQHRRFETSDASARRVVQFTIGLSLAVFVVMFILWFAYSAFMGSAPNAKGNRVSAWSYADKRARQIHDDRQEQAEQEADRLGNYGWIDSSRGLARIPIQRAMELVARNGLPEPSGENFPKTLVDMAHENATEE